EHWALALLPLAAWCVEVDIPKGAKNPRPRRGFFAPLGMSTGVGLGALAVAALLLTHNLSGLLFLPFLVLYVVLRAGALRSRAALGGGALLLLGGALLSAFYWLPAVAEFSGVRQGAVPLNPQ